MPILGIYAFGKATKGQTVQYEKKMVRICELIKTTRRGQALHTSWPKVKFKVIKTSMSIDAMHKSTAIPSLNAIA